MFCQPTLACQFFLVFRFFWNVFGTSFRCSLFPSKNLTFLWFWQFFFWIRTYFNNLFWLNCLCLNIFLINYFVSGLLSETVFKDLLLSRIGLLDTGLHNAAPTGTNPESLAVIKSFQILIFVKTIPALTNKTMTSLFISSIQNFEMILRNKMRFIKISNFLSTKTCKALHVLMMFLLDL